VGLVGVTEIGGQRRPVHIAASFGAQRGLVQAGAAHHPLRRDADVLPEQPLQPALRDAEDVRERRHPAQPGIGHDPLRDAGDLLGHRIGPRAGAAQQAGRRRDHRLVGGRGEHRATGPLRRGPEDAAGGNHAVVQSGNLSRAVEGPETARAEAHAERPAGPGDPAGENAPVDAVNTRPGRLEGEVHVRVRQDRLLVGGLAAQIPLDHPADVDERRQVLRRAVPAQAEPGRRGSGAQDPGAHRGGGSVHFAQRSCRVSSRRRRRAAASLLIHEPAC
jgi:hypothetical protein